MRKAAVFALILIVGGLLAITWQRRPSPETPAPQITPAVQPTQQAEAPMPTSTSTADPASLQKTLDDTRPVLQQKAAIAQNKDVHTIPPQTIDAAQRLATVIELQEQHPEEAARFQAFFLECARDESVITVIRAQCLDRYVKAAKLDAAARKTLLGDFPPEITRLFEALQ